MNGAKLRLVAAAALFVGWIVWLGYTALSKNRGPVVSHVQVAASAHAVVAEVKAGADGKPAREVKVTESLRPGSPAAGTELFIMNIGDAKGFEGPGEYLLLLEGNRNYLVGMQRSPGYEPSSINGPLIYRMSESVRQQFQKLMR